jgi:flavin-dependent dehydrogenase
MLFAGPRSCDETNRELYDRDRTATVVDIPTNPNPMVFDVAIVGGGPAAAAAALSLREQMPEARVAIFAAAPTTRWKPGETLSPAARPLLESLGCWAELQRTAEAGGALENYGTESVWGSDALEEREFLFSTHGNGWSLDRAQFDAMLIGRAQVAGAIVHLGAALMESAEEDSHWRLDLAGATAEARFVIDATGRTARFATARGSRLEVKDSLAGVCVLFDCTGANVHERGTLIEAQEHGWWYSTSVPGGTLVAAWMTDTDLIREMRLKDAARWHALLAQSRQTRRRIERAKPTTLPMIFAAQSQRLSKVAGTGWAAAGDAAMAFDPLSSHGITKALRSGKLASFVALDWLRNGQDTHSRYCSIADAEWAQYEATRRAYYAEEQRWPSSVFWARRHGTH